ncbi:MAG: hypothetical protein ACI35S_06245 [Anaeroplasma sp.]
MKKVVVSIQNTLINEAVYNALEKKSLFVKKTNSQEISQIHTLCDIFCPNVLIMDVNRIMNCNYEMRIKVVKDVKKLNKDIKICLLCNNTSEPEIAHKVKSAKEDGLIDAFFYESVQTDYLTDVIESL